MTLELFVVPQLKKREVVRTLFYTAAKLALIPVVVLLALVAAVGLLAIGSG
jgi:hypothetical protein